MAKKVKHQKLYKETDVHVDCSMVYFYCVK